MINRLVAFFGHYESGVTLQFKFLLLRLCKFMIQEDAYCNVCSAPLMFLEMKRLLNQSEGITHRLSSHHDRVDLSLPDTTSLPSTSHCFSFISYSIYVFVAFVDDTGTSAVWAAQRVPDGEVRCVFTSLFLFFYSPFPTFLLFRTLLALTILFFWHTATGIFLLSLFVRFALSPSWCPDPMKTKSDHTLRAKLYQHSCSTSTLLRI